MGKKIQENWLEILIVGLFTIFGFALMIYVFAADTVRAEIVSASPIRANTYEVEEARSKDDPDYDPIYNSTKTTHSTKYYRTVTIVEDGEQVDIELSSDFKFMLPGEGRSITFSRTYDGGFFREYPVRNFAMGAVLGFGGLAIIVAVCRPNSSKKKASKKKKSKK